VFTTSAVIFLIVLYLFIKKRWDYVGLILIPLVVLGPVYSPIQVAWIVAERYLYLGSAFFCMLIVLLILKIKNDDAKTLVIVGLFLFYLIRTIVRTEDWKTNKSLWIATQKVSPRSYRVYNNLGDVYSKEKNYELAILNFAKSTEYKPAYAAAWHNLGFTYYMAGNVEKAIENLTKSTQLKPNLYQAYYKLGIIELQRGNYAVARDHLTTVTKLVPNHQEAYKALVEIDRLVNQ